MVTDSQAAMDREIGVPEGAVMMFLNMLQTVQVSFDSG